MLSYRVHYRETGAPTCAGHDLLDIHQVDWLVSYPLVFIHLRYQLKPHKGIILSMQRIVVTAIEIDWENLYSVPFALCMSLNEKIMI